MRDKLTNFDAQKLNRECAVSRLVQIMQPPANLGRLPVDELSPIKSPFLAAKQRIIFQRTLAHLRFRQFSTKNVKLGQLFFTIYTSFFKVFKIKRLFFKRIIHRSWFLDIFGESLPTDKTMFLTRWEGWQMLSTSIFSKRLPAQLNSTHFIIRKLYHDPVVKAPMHALFVAIRRFCPNR